MQQPVKKEARFEGVQRFFRNVSAELKKVNWPSRKELTTYTIVVIATVLVVSVIITTWDWLLTVIFKVFGFYR
ncbi:preprotein translocase subunit SecE [Hydrogenispora ethanolica]|uniref:Protein translocase subunit SecE n=1 Tax=Hydrogenispora ethanolica TaxID=1082276 RepID=A0A4R1QKU2_HYDET|nr:preprotein translocase subunit SecE [Hydrogenispora ethanolica]TCL54298.1 preprotein translocase subunit SecE [Hydrogenispora ethanolica]